MRDRQTDRQRKVYRLTSLSVGEVIKQSVGNRWMNMGPYWNDNDREKTAVLGEKPIEVPLRPPQIPLEVAWFRLWIQ